MASYCTGSDLSEESEIESEESTELLLPYKSVNTETLVRNWAIKHQIKHCALWDIVKIIAELSDTETPIICCFVIR